MWSTRKDPVKEVLDRYVDQDFKLFACGENVPSEAEITEFESMAGFMLPKDFRAFSMSSLGGIYIEVKEQVWPRAKEFDVGPFWTFLYGLFTFGFGTDIPEWMDIRIQTLTFRGETGHQVVPFLKIVGDADLYCFDKSGRVRRWRHETDELDPVDGCFLDVFELEVKDLKDRKGRKKTDRA